LSEVANCENEKFSGKPDAADDRLSLSHNFLSEVVRCEAGRRLKIRSLPSVNEEFSDKPDAADDRLSQEFTYVLVLTL
jgi:hypothetical protein